MLVLDMIFVDWIVKKGKNKSTGTLRHISHALDPLGFGGVIAITIERNQKIQTLQIIDNMRARVCVCVCVCVCDNTIEKYKRKMLLPSKE